jgi:hypothetical protein
VLAELGLGPRGDAREKPLPAARRRPSITFAWSLRALEMICRAATPDEATGTRRPSAHL